MSETETCTDVGTRFLDALTSRDYWAVKGVDPEVGLNVYEQTAYAEVVDGEIAQMRLACSGHRRL